MKRAPPFDTWPVEIHDPAFGYRWYRAGAILIDHITVAHGTVDTVAAMHASLDDLIRAHQEEIDASNGLQIIGDWRSVTSYEPAARQRFLSELHKKRPIRGAVVIMSHTGVFLRMAVQAARMVTAVSGGPTIAVSEDMDTVLDEYGLRTVGRKSLFPPS